MESAWVKNGFRPSTPAAFSLNPHASAFVPRLQRPILENNGSASAKTSPPPAPFLLEIQHSMPNSLETTNVTPASFYPGQMVHPQAQFVSVPLYNQVPLIQNYVAEQPPPNYVQFPLNQLTQTEELELAETQHMSLDNEQSNVNQLPCSGTLNEQISDPIHKTYETYSGDFGKREGHERFISGKESRYSEESDQEKSVSAPNDQLPHKNVSQSQQYRGPRGDRGRESSRDNDRSYWNEEHVDNRSTRSFQHSQPYHKANRGRNEDYNWRSREKRFLKGNDNFSHRGHYQETSVDPSDEEGLNKRSDRYETPKGHNEDYYSRGRGRGSRSSRGYDNISHRGQKHFEYLEKSVYTSNEECFNKRSDISTEKIQYNEKGRNEDGHRRGRGKGNQYFGGNETFSYGDPKKDYGKNSDSHEYGSGRGMTRESFEARDRTSRDRKNLTRELSVNALKEKPFGQGHDKNDQKWPNKRGGEKGNDRDIKNWNYYNEKRDARHEEPSDINPEHEDLENKYESNNNIDDKARNEHSSEKGGSKNLEESNFFPGLDKNDHKRGKEKGNGKMGDKGSSHNYKKQGDSRHQEPRQINQGQGDSQRKYGSGINRDEREKYEHLSEGSNHNYKTNYSNRTKSLQESDKFWKNESEPNIGNTEKSNQSKKETKIQHATYSEKTQNKIVKKNYADPKENDSRDRKRELSNENRDYQRHRSNVSEDSKEKAYDKRKRNAYQERENPENKFKRSNQPRKFDSGREIKHYGNISSNIRNTGSDNCDFDRRDFKNLENENEHVVGNIAQKESKIPDFSVDLETEDIQQPEAQAMKGRLSKEKDKRNTQKSVSKCQQSFSDKSEEDNNSNFCDSLSLMDSIMAEENKVRKQNRVYQENSTTTKDDDKKNKKDTRRKPDDIETRKFLDPRMEREKEKTVDGSEGVRVTVPRESSTKVVTSYVDDSLEKEKRDKEYDIWDNHWEEIDDFKSVHEIEGDLFEQPKDFSLAHCVAEDLRMGSGIAVAFKREFKNLPNLLDQRAKQGGLATISDQETGRFVYYLVTKKESSGKPTYYTMWKSLFKMRDHIRENKVKKLAVPRLGCGLDRLEWDKVKAMLEYLFKNVDIEIRVCNFQQLEHESDYKSKCKLVMENVPVTKIDPGTLILYLVTAKGDEDDVIKNMSQKFNFWPSFKRQEKTLGDIVYFDDKAQNYGICACIVRKTKQEPISFVKLHSCLQKINKKNKEFGNDCFEYVALQWVDPNDYFDDLINQKLITMLINFLRNVNVHVCNGDFEEQKT